MFSNMSHKVCRLLSCPVLLRKFTIIENEDFFSPFSKTKYASKCTIFESFSLFHTKTLNQWKYDSITYGACAILVVYDV